jgi:hypothetical protein
MRVAIVPASTKTAVAAIESLLHTNETAGKRVEIRAFYRDRKRVPNDFKTEGCFQAVQGSPDDADSLDFSHVDAVLTITPPAVTTDQAEVMSRNVKEAIEKAGCVRKLVLLSSLGAHLAEGVVCFAPII